MDKFEEFYKQHCLDHFGYDPDLNWIFEKHEDGSYIQIEVENAKKVFNHQQAKVEELQQENQRLANGNTSYYNQAIKQNEIIEGLQVKLKQAYEDVDTFATAHEALEQRVDRDRSLIQFTQQANKDLVAERDELQKRVDLVKRELKAAKEGHYGFNDEGADIDSFIFDLEQALKGEG